MIARERATADALVTAATRNAARYWRERFKSSGESGYARLINTSSAAGLIGSQGQPNYATAKAGISAFTVSAARSDLT